MIVYPLACDRNHFFEGWFASSEAFDRQREERRVVCPACSSAMVRKLPSAPYVHAAGGSAAAEPRTDSAETVSAVQGEVVKALRQFILGHTEDVGRRFAEVARRIHYGEEAARGIRGEVTRDEAAALEEEGVPAIAVPEAILPVEEIH